MSVHATEWEIKITLIDDIPRNTIKHINNVMGITMDLDTARITKQGIYVTHIENLEEANRLEEELRNRFSNLIK
jgi:hypothetical protein